MDDAAKKDITVLLGQGLITQEQHDQFLSQDQFYRDFSKHGYSPATNDAAERKIAQAARGQAATSEPEPEPASP